MYVTFEEIYLRELYETGKTSDKKHRYQPDIVRRYQRCVDYLLDAPGIERIKSINSLNYEVLKGDKQGISSIRVVLETKPTNSWGWSSFIPSTKWLSEKSMRVGYVSSLCM